MNPLRNKVRELYEEVMNLAGHAGSGVTVTSAAFRVYDSLQEGAITFEIKVDGTKLTDYSDYSQADYSQVDDMPF